MLKGSEINISTYSRLFEEIDQDGDDMISPSELRELLLEVKFDRMHIDKEKAIAEVIKEFDIDSDQKITKDEFVNGLAKWLDEAKNAIDKRYYSRKSLREIYRVINKINCLNIHIYIHLHMMSPMDFISSTNIQRSVDANYLGITQMFDRFSSLGFKIKGKNGK